MGWFDDFLAAEKNPVKLMWGALPPNVRDAYSSGARSLATLAGELSPGAAFRDAGQESVNMMDAVREGNWMDAAAGPAKMVTAMAGIVPVAKGAKMATNVAQEAIAPIRAYHGSPHSFDRFDISKIGTGEGAQAYGHGLYFAENEGVAKVYRDALSGDAISLGGQKIVPTPGSPQDMALAWLRSAPQDAEPFAAARRSLRSTRDVPETTPAMRERYDAALKALDDWQVAGGKPTAGGHMYEVGIHADPAKMLNWDKPSSQQHPEVQKIFRDLGLDREYKIAGSSSGNGPFMVRDAKSGSTVSVATTREEAERLGRSWADPQGANVYQSSKLVPGDYRDQAAASARLLEAGIPGIKYLDQGSRTAGQGSSNYVVFDPSIIEIMRKYGLLPATVAAGVGGASMLPTDNAPQGGLF